VCGVQFAPKNVLSKYCSVRCSKKVWKIRNKNNAALIAYNKAYNKKYGSEHRKEIVDTTCEWCKTVFLPTQYGMKFCCKDHCQKAQKRKVVFNGKARERMAEYKQRNPEKVRESNLRFKNKSRYGGNKYIVLERDGNKCTRCGEQKITKLLIHHLDGSGQTDSPNNSLENLVTICRKCHPKIHYSKKAIIF
jgi:hypothetical protein